MKVIKIKDSFTNVVFCCPSNKLDYMLSLGYTFEGYTNFDTLENSVKKMLVEFSPKSDFDFIKMNWLPIFTTQKMRINFNAIQKNDSINFEKELKDVEYWDPGKIKTNNYLNALINNCK